MSHFRPPPSPFDRLAPRGQPKAKSPLTPGDQRSDEPSHSTTKSSPRSSPRKPPPAPLRPVAFPTASPLPSAAAPQTPARLNAPRSNPPPTPSTPRTPSSLSRSKRGRRRKGGMDPASPTTNPKPLSIEVAIAQMKVNPFSGGPITPRVPLTAIPSLSQSSSAKLVPPSTSLSSSTLSAVPPAPPSEHHSTRPHTPSTHIDWANDDDDGSLPDLDDWMSPPADTSSASNEEDDSSNPRSLPPVSEPPPPQQPPVVYIMLPKEANDSVPPIQPPYPVFQGPDKHPVEDVDEEVVRVLLPGWRMVECEQEPTPTATKGSHGSSDNSFLVPPLDHHTSQRNAAPGARPSSFSHPHPRSAPLNPRFDWNNRHTRTQSLPHSRSTPRLHSRPILSSAALSQISRSLAPSPKARDFETIVGE